MRNRKKWLCCNYIWDRSFGSAAKFIYIHKFFFRSDIFFIVVLFNASFSPSRSTLRPFYMDIILWVFVCVYVAESAWKFTTICKFIHYQHLWNVRPAWNEQKRDVQKMAQKSQMHTHNWNSFEYVAAFYFAHFILHHSCWILFFYFFFHFLAFLCKCNRERERESEMETVRQNQRTEREISS